MPATMKAAGGGSAGKLKTVGGRLVSAKSKTGNPLCSQAMSLWQRSLHGGAAVGRDVYAMLGRCRSQARQNKKAAQLQAAGKLAEGRGTWQRAEAAAAEVARRKATARAKAPAPAPSRDGPFGAHVPVKAREVTPYRNATAKTPAPSGFALEAQSAKGSKAFADDGKGKTKVLFEGMRGAAGRDLPGQSTMFGAKTPKAPGRSTDARKAEASALRAARPHLKAALAEAKAARVPTRSVSAPAFAELTGMKPEQAAMAPALYRVSENRIVVNRGAAYWLDPAAAARRNKGHLSTTDPLHAIRHEIGHALHYRKIAAANAPAIRALGAKTKDQLHAQAREQFRYGAAQGVKPFGLKAKDVSGYGVKSQGEAVAEIYAGLKGGRKFDDQTMQFYRNAHGPVVAPKASTPPAPPAAGDPPKGVTARMARLAPRVGGGSPMAVLDSIHTQELRRSAKAKVIRSQRAKLAAARVDPATHTDHAPGHVGKLDTKLIHFDPDRFQYKQGAQGAHGVTDALQGVEHYDPNKGGILQVWKDPADGKTYVVNGHHRLDLAKRLGADRVAVHYIKAHSADQARGIGALTNIAEGRGTALDAAKYFHGSKMGAEDAKRGGIPLKEKVASEGLSIANLHGHLFDRAMSGELPASRAAILGRLDHAGQKALWSGLGKHASGRGPSDAALSEAVAHAKHAPTVTKMSRGLFGDDPEELNLSLHRGAAANDVRERLRDEKRIFGTVSRGRNAETLKAGNNSIDAAKSGEISAAAAQNLATFDLLKHRRGAVSDLLNEAATRIHKGEKKKAVHADVYRRLPAAVQSALSGG